MNAVQYIEWSSRSFFGRIQDAIICFWDLLTFSIRILRNLKLPNLLRYHIISSLIFRFLMKWKYSWFPSICFGFFPYLNQSKLHFLFFRKNRLKEELTINKIIPFENCFGKYFAVQIRTTTGIKNNAVKKERKGRRVEKVKAKSLYISPAERLWQYGLWSFQMGG